MKPTLAMILVTGLLYAMLWGAVTIGIAIVLIEMKNI